MTLKPTENFLKGIDYLADMALRHGGLQALDVVTYIRTELRAAHAVAEAAKNQTKIQKAVTLGDELDVVKEAEGVYQTDAEESWSGENGNGV